MAIRTTHVGSLPRTAELLDANSRRKDMGEQMFAQVLQKSVNDVVSWQHEIGIDWVNDGEYGHAMTESLDFGSWWSYSFSRFGGIELTDEPSELAPPAPDPRSHSSISRIVVTGRTSPTSMRIHHLQFCHIPGRGTLMTEAPSHQSSPSSPGRSPTQALRRYVRTSTAWSLPWTPTESIVGTDSSPRSRPARQPVCTMPTTPMTRRSCRPVPRCFARSTWRSPRPG